MQSFAKGNHGDEVVDIQVKLSALGYTLGSDGADGSFGDTTEEAVVEFQRSRHLKSTGIVDEATWRALVEATYKFGGRLLYLRSPFFRGDDVRELQLSLNTLGFNTGIVDGIFGETTERAVRDFQLNFGLPSDGIFGPSSLTAIRNLKHLLSSKASQIFPDPYRNQHSAISVFSNRRIVIDLGTLYDEVGLYTYESELDSEIDVAQDLGMRLGNLLELLGANVIYTGENRSDDLSDVELYIGFRLNASEDIEERGSIVLYCIGTDGEEPECRRLALAVQEEIVRSFGSRNLGIQPTDVTIDGILVPAIFVKPFFITNPAEKNLLNEEVNRQKIAVAVFDGIKNYLQFS
ncbi:MAG TPA: peptidoglycan-binding protein [Candidatus Aquicultor sp.]|jgi:N-acetylmuramoyl-L-alanine amidase